jgi:hypothetical protein
VDWIVPAQTIVDAAPSAMARSPISKIARNHTFDTAEGGVLAPVVASVIPAVENAGAVVVATAAYSPQLKVGMVAVVVISPPTISRSELVHEPTFFIYPAGTRTGGIPAVIVTAPAVGTDVVASA